MDSITNLYEVRRDGKVIKEGMTFEEIAAFGEISKVVEMHWTDRSTGQPASIKSPFGVFGALVQGRDFIVATIYSSKSNCRLISINANGSTRCTFSDTQKINGQDEFGSFGWVETTHYPNNVFGAIFTVDCFPVTQYRLDIDVITAEVLACSWTK